MRQVRTHAFAVPDAGVWLWPHELQACYGLQAWCIALLVHLAARSNFKTGIGRTGYGELVNALTPDQPERGPRLWAPSRLDVKRALRRFEELRILTVDKLQSEQVQAVNFSLAPRVAQRVPARKLDRELDPGSTEVKAPKLDPGIRPGLTTEILNTARATPPVDNSGRGRAKAVQVLEALRPAGGRTRAPKGA